MSRAAAATWQQFQIHKTKVVGKNNNIVKAQVSPFPHNFEQIMKINEEYCKKLISNKLQNCKVGQDDVVKMNERVFQNRKCVMIINEKILNLNEEVVYKDYSFL